MARSVHPQSETNFGEPIKYDPDFHGPLKGRSCTDILCLLIFVVFIACWIGIGIYAKCLVSKIILAIICVLAFKAGDSDLLFIPKDSDGKRCGHDSDVRDKPYLFFMDLTKCVDPKVVVTSCKTTQICVKECPKDNYYLKIDGFKPEKLSYCKGPPPTNENDLQKRIEDGTCPRFYIKSIPVAKRCLPKITDIPSNFKDIASDVRKAVKNIKYLTYAEEFVSLITEDLIQSGWKIILGFLGAMIVCLLYIVLMRYIAGVMVYLSIIGVIALLVLGVVMTALQYKKLQKEKLDVELENIASLWEQKNFVLALLIILSCVLIISLLVLLFLRKRIVIAIALIREGSKAVSAVTSALFFPIVPWILQILVIAYAITVGLYLTSVGTPQYTLKSPDGCASIMNGSTCDPQHHNYDYSRAMKDASCSQAACTMDAIQKPVIVKIFHAVNIVGLFWGVFFISALGEMVLAATFATWYWTYRKTDVPFFTLTHSVLRTFRYHIGTLAFGSLIITICRLIRIAIEYIDYKLKKYDNAFVRAILCCCRCCFWCLENFLKFINKNAYIMCAIHGKNFCSSAKDAFNLLMRNVIRVIVVDKVTDMLLFLGKILITGAVAVVAYTAFTNADFNMIDTEDLHYVVVPVVAIAIGTYFITSVFFSVYSMAVDTLFLCFLEDCERNDGSPEKPYFMSKELMKILGKKNKLS